MTTTVATIAAAAATTHIERGAEWQFPAGAADVGGLRIAGNDPILGGGIPIAEIPPREIGLECCALARCNG